MIRMLTFTILSAAALAGDYHSVAIREEADAPCCQCDCEYDPQEDVTWYGEDLRERYTYFGGVPHVCIGVHHKDEKGVDLNKKHSPHVCRGEWCPKECCMTLENYLLLKWGNENLLPGGNILHPVMPTPPPASSMN